MFRSGRYVGFYCYSDGGGKHRQVMVLSFEAGAVTGDGGDDLGVFEVRGTCSGCSTTFVKTYIGGHSVVYEGALNGRVITGAWIIGTYSGRFRLWPHDQPLPTFEATKRKVGICKGAIPPGYGGRQ